MVTLRDQLQSSVGSAYRVGEQRGKTKLDIRIKNGTRQLKNFDMAWVPTNSRNILENIENIAGLVTRRKISRFYETILRKAKLVPEMTSAASLSRQSLC